MEKILILLSIVLLSACNKKEQPATTATPTAADQRVVNLTAAQLQQAGIATEKMVQRPIASILKVNGTIDVPPQNTIWVNVPMGGYLKSTRLIPGMPVKKGQVIASLEDGQYIELQQDYLMAKVELAYLEKEFERQQALNQSKASSDKIFQQTSADYLAKQIAIKSLSEKLRLIGIDPDKLNQHTLSRSIQVHSPVNGFVSKVNGVIGQYMAPTDMLFELIDPSDLHLKLQVYEKDLDKIFIGQHLLSYTNNKPEKKYAGEIIFINKDISEARSVEVHCHFNKSDLTLIPGMFMNAEIEVTNNQAQTLPEEAIVRYENKEYAFVATGNNQFEIIEVKTGDMEKGYTAVSVPESLQDKAFVTKGAYSLLMKMKNKSEE